jgi:hypothetical protein
MSTNGCGEASRRDGCAIITYTPTAGYIVHILHIPARFVGAKDYSPRVMLIFVGGVRKA